MTIQVDDAGWGSLVGGVLIGACRIETGEFRWDLIPVGEFQEPLFSTRHYLEAVSETAKDLLDQLDTPTDETILVCSGWVLSGFRHWLAAQNGAIDWHTEIIGEPLQSRIEQAFCEYLAEEFDLKVDPETSTQKHGLFFWKCVEWLHGGHPDRCPHALPEREEHCKTGWPSFRIWADHPWREARQLAAMARKHRRQERWETV